MVDVDYWIFIRIRGQLVKKFTTGVCVQKEVAMRSFGQIFSRLERRKLLLLKLGQNHLQLKKSRQFTHIRIFRVVCAHDNKEDDRACRPRLSTSNVILNFHLLLATACAGTARNWCVQHLIIRGEVFPHLQIPRRAYRDLDYEVESRSAQVWKSSSSALHINHRIVRRAVG